MSAVRPRPGEDWQTPEGRNIHVDSVEGEAVIGSATPPTFSASGEPRPGVGVGHYDGMVGDFERYELVGPRWTVTVQAPVEGSHPTTDPVFEAMRQLGQVERRSLPAEGEPPGFGRATYQVAVVTLSAEEARERVVSALAPFEAVAAVVVAVGPA